MTKTSTDRVMAMVISSRRQSSYRPTKLQALLKRNELVRVNSLSDLHDDQPLFKYNNYHRKTRVRFAGIPSQESSGACTTDYAVFHQQPGLLRLDRSVELHLPASHARSGVLQGSLQGTCGLTVQVRAGTPRPGPRRSPPPPARTAQERPARRPAGGRGQLIRARDTLAAQGSGWRFGTAAGGSIARADRRWHAHRPDTERQGPSDKRMGYRPSPRRKRWPS
jgi:hypothetical protein